MKKKYSLIIIAFLCAFVTGFGQGSETFTSLTAATGSYENGSYTGDNGIIWTYDGARSVTATYNITGRTLGFGDSGAGTRNITGTSDANGVGDLTYSVSRYFTGGTAADRTIEVYVNGTLYDTYTLAAEGPIYTRTFTADETGAVSIEFRSTGSRQIVIDDVSWTTGVSCTDAVDWANIQFPTASPQTITEGDNFDVYTHAVEPGVTDASATAPGPGVEAWVGYSTTDSDPSGTGWTWIAATYNTDIGANDEFFAEIGSGLASGTYYYASRYRLNNCNVFVYGGTSGVWSTGNSVQLIVNPDQVDFCNVDFPKAATITTGDTFNVYAQAYEPGVTDAAGQGANMEAWIGYNTVGINHQPWDPTGWTWVAATYDSDSGNNDQYVAEIGSGRTSGTYFYASRFRLYGSDFSYGGIAADNVGNFWDATNNNGTLTVNDPPVADVVITEIMYNSTGTDDEWIEICNLNATAQDISNYEIEVNNSSVYNFPASTSIPANSCITVALGDNGSAPFNPGCPFTADYGSPSGTNILTNSTRTIELVASDNTTVIDAVTYSTGDGANGNGSSLHVVDATADNSDATSANWQEVIVGGSPGDNTLVPPCAVPELQLENSSGSDQACGTYILDFGSQTIGFTTDLSFRIDNDGSNDLDISSITITGDYTIVSPAAPFTVTGGASQTVTVRFTPTANGTRTGLITINNNDADEFDCMVNLTGEGLSPAPEINVTGGGNSITGDGLNVPVGFNNTLFASRAIGASQNKVFVINNEGTLDLNISSIVIGGSHPGDFMIFGTPPGNTITSGNSENLEIRFTPTAAGVRTATITINNDDADESGFVYNIQGTGTCNTATYTLSPSSGPAGSIVTVTASSGSNPNSATALYDGNTTTITGISASVFEITIPTNSISADITFDDATGCQRSIPFTVIDNDISSCQGTNTAPTEIFISEVTDRDSSTDGHTYVELFNGTGGAINISNYTIEVHSNGNSSANGTVNIPNGTTLANDDTYVVSLGTGSTVVDPVGENDYFSANTIGINDRDHIILTNGTVDIDLWGDTSGNPFTVGTGTEYNSSTPNGSDYTYRRRNTVSAPSLTWNPSDWDGLAPVNYSDIGNYDFSAGSPPNVTTQPIPLVSECDLTASFTVAGQETYTGAGNNTTPAALTYQWYYSAPGDTGWTPVPDDATYDDVDTVTLQILNTLNAIDYQFYCQIRENDATCFRASNATRLNIQKAEWDGMVWLNGVTPSSSRVVVINGDYDTVDDGSFSACQLIINATHKLTINDATFVEVENYTTVNGDLWVETSGAFVQNADLTNGFTINTGGNALVNKSTTVLNNWYDYTYWSSPIVDETIEDALDIAPDNRRFWFDATRFEDVLLDNTDNVDPGSDDIDDTGDDWQVATVGSTMTPGVGYAATVLPVGFTSRSYQATFEGEFNNGVVQVPIYYNGANGDNDWNFIGNPYPSAIRFQDLYELAINAGIIDGAAYFWSHASPPERDNDGNELLNFNTDDYAIYTVSSGGIGAGTASMSGSATPNGYVASGQGFFVKALSNGTLTFNNSMRQADITSNSQFFRTASRTDSANRLWLNLTSDNGAFNQILVAYVDGATNGFDGFSYDAQRNLSSGAASVIYTEIEGDARKFAIQGKPADDLNIDEVIPFGFYTTIDVATIYSFSIPQTEGEFFENNTAYLHDTFLNIYHDLNASDYTFTSETGEFNDRFEIVFNPDSLSIDENELNNALSIIELQDGSVKFTVSNNLEIKNVKIYDTLGRLLYNLEGNSHTEIYNLSNLSQAAYVAQVTLSNDIVVTKKAVKRN